MQPVSLTPPIGEGDTGMDGLAPDAVSGDCARANGGPRMFWLRTICVTIALLLPLAGCLSEASTPGVHTTGGPAQLVDVSTRQAAALNGLRARHGLQSLGTDPVLSRIARGHAQDMMSNRFFGHVSSDGRTIVERTRQQGYAFCHVAENLAMGQPDFDAVIRQWMTSPSHRSNLLHPNVDDFGLIRGPGNLWVLVLGRPGC